MKADIGKFNQLVSGESKWLEQARKRKENAGWLSLSQNIAVKVLKTLRTRQMKQTELAQLMQVSPQQVSKILQGKENLTLETISKLERILDVKLVTVADEVSEIRHQIQFRKELVYLTVYSNKTELQPMRQTIKMNKVLYTESYCNQPQYSYGS